MLVVRYFTWVGGALLALLMIAGWMWPATAPSSAPADEAAAQSNPTNSTILRIHSARKWPEKVVIDTSIPTIVPPSPSVMAAAPSAPAPVVAENTAAPKSLDARAELKSSAAAGPRRQARVVHHRTPRSAVSTWANANPAPPSWGWSNSPHWSWNW